MLINQDAAGLDDVFRFRIEQADGPDVGFQAFNTQVEDACWRVGDRVKFPYVAVPLYLLLGGRKRDRAIKHKRALERLEVDADIHPVGAMQKLLDAYHCSLPLPNHSLSMLTDGVAGYRAVCGLIDSAQSSIDLATYVYRPDAVGLDILARLTARAQAGIRVRLLLDAVGAGKIKTNHLREFRAAGGKAAYFMPIFKGWKITRGDLRNHRKILAVDGVRVMAGGTNIADEYIGPTARADRWQDLSFLLEWSVIAGSVIGGIAMLKLSINRALWIFGFVQLITILGFAWLSVVGHSPVGLFIVVSAEYLGVGLGTVALTAYISRETSRAFTATQFALFTSFIAVPRTFANASTGFLIEAIGYTQFFLLCTAVAVPGMLMLFKAAPWDER